MRLLYDLLFTLLFLLSSPYYFYRLWRRGNWRKGFRQRLGEYDRNVQQSLTNRHVIWVHAVSVGEMTVCAALVNALQRRFPNAKLLVSTTTTTGMAELQKRLPPQVAKVYYPIDRRSFVNQAFSALQPHAIILVEGEIWPNFIWRSQTSPRPLFLVNGRLSDRSYARYKRLGFLFRGLFGAFTGVGAQTREFAEKFAEIGCRPGAIQVLGNLKFDTANLHASTLDVPELLGRLGLGPEPLILVGGSTHPGEEEILAAQFLRLRRKFPGLFLVLVPRHFERAGTVRAQLTKMGLRTVARTELGDNRRFEAGAVDCLLVDTTGELMNFYQCATVAFVGKSLAAEGGQNPIEPAAWGKPVVFGPNMGNFRDVVRIFLQREAALQVRDAAELEQAFESLLSDPARREQLGTAARQVVRENQGAIARTVEMMVEPLRARGLYVEPQPES